MKRLGYTQFVAQGGDVGALVTNAMAEQAPPELLGMHTNLPGTVPPAVGKALACGDLAPASLSLDEKTAYDAVQNFRVKHSAYAAMMATRPQTLYGLADSPIGLAVWLLDHGDGYGQPAPAIVSAVLGRSVDGHFLEPASIGKIRDERLKRRQCLHPGCREYLSWRDLSSPAELDGTRLPQLLTEGVRAGFRPLRT
jgi:hypothetical protein